MHRICTELKLPQICSHAEDLYRAKATTNMWTTELRMIPLWEGTRKEGAAIGLECLMRTPCKMCKDSIPKGGSKIYMLEAHAAWAGDHRTPGYIIDWLHLTPGYMDIQSYWLATPFPGIYGYSELLPGYTVPWDIWIFRVIDWLHRTLGYMDIQSYWLTTPYHGYSELLNGYTVPWYILYRVI